MELEEDFDEDERHVSGVLVIRRISVNVAMVIEAHDSLFNRIFMCFSICFLMPKH